MHKNSFQDQFERQRRHLPQVKASTANMRIKKLQALRTAIQSQRFALYEALKRDLGKSSSEVELTEYLPTLTELSFAIRHLKSWMRPQPVPSPLTLFLSRSEIRYEPKGQVLIIGPWNYPFYLIMAPLISAIAAGNCAVVKPSEVSPFTSQFLKKLIFDLFSVGLFSVGLFNEEEVSCIEGDHLVAQELLKLPFDHIFFTGSSHVGKVVLEAAAKHLTSVTLELGGKSPVIIDISAHLKRTAKHLVWGKFMNAGQTCVAPDYVLVPEALLPKLIAEISYWLKEFYGAEEEQRSRSEAFSRIINTHHHERLKALLSASTEAGARIIAGGQWIDSERYIAPTVLTCVTPDSPLMKEEIFGPLLPLLTYRTLNEAYEIIERHEKPLALYIFSEYPSRVEEIIKRTNAGGTSVNTTLLHLSNPHLPFGGTGPSGMGNYHGFFGFKTFSHERAVLRQGAVSALEMIFPPYKNWVRQLIRVIAHWFT